MERYRTRTNDEVGSMSRWSSSQIPKLYFSTLQKGFRKAEHNKQIQDTNIKTSSPPIS